MENYRVSRISTEEAQARSAAFEATRNGAAFAKKLQTTQAGYDTFKTKELDYIRNQIAAGGDLWDILSGVYSIGYERGQKAAKRAGK